MIGLKTSSRFLNPLYQVLYDMMDIFDNKSDFDDDNGHFYIYTSPENIK